MMIRSPKLLLFPTVAVLLFSCFVESLRFELQSGAIKCIAEDIKSKAMSVGKYHIVNPNEGYPLPDTHKISVRVTAAAVIDYHKAENVSSGQFAFTASEGGDYLACFSAADHNPPVTFTIDFEWKTGIQAKDWGSVAKKGSIDVMELELKKLQDTVITIHDEMFYLREREEEMQELNRTTNSRMAWLSLLSFLVCLSVAGLQFWHLKNFFVKKKLI